MPKFTKAELVKKAGYQRAYTKRQKEKMAALQAEVVRLQQLLAKKSK